MKHQTHQRHVGSTIIEVLIATVVIGFALTGLALLMTANVKNSAEADYRTAAAGLAQNAMEKIRQRKNTTSWNEFSANPISGVSECSAAPTVRYGTEFYFVCDDTSVPDQVLLNITVCWPVACGTATNTTEVSQRFYNN